jgi:hypothetical protein
VVDGFVVRALHPDVQVLPAEAVQGFHHIGGLAVGGERGGKVDGETDEMLGRKRRAEYFDHGVHRFIQSVVEPWEAFL